MLGLFLCLLLAAFSPPLCPCSPYCHCCDDGLCPCIESCTVKSKQRKIPGNAETTATAAVNTGEDAIERARKVAAAAKVNLIVRVSNCPLDGMTLPQTALHCSVSAVEDVDGPCVYVGTYADGDIREWTRYRPPPRQYVHQPQPCLAPPMFLPMGCGMGGCGMGGCGMGSCGMMMGGCCGGGCCR